MVWLLFGKMFHRVGGKVAIDFVLAKYAGANSLWCTMMDPAEKLEKSTLFVDTVREEIRAFGWVDPGHIEVSYARADECDTFGDLHNSRGITLVHLENPKEPVMLSTKLGAQEACLPEAGPKGPEALSFVTLAAQMQELKQMIVELSGKNTNLEQQVGGLKAEVKVLTEQNSSLKQQVGELAEQNSSLKQQVKELTEQNSSLKQQVKELTDKVEAMDRASSKNYSLALSSYHDMEKIYEDSAEEMAVLSESLAGIFKALATNAAFRTSRVKSIVEKFKAEYEKPAR